MTGVDARAENEQLRGEIERLRRDLAAEIDSSDAAAARLAELDAAREALREIRDTPTKEDEHAARALQQIARAVLGESSGQDVPRVELAPVHGRTVPLPEGWRKLEESTHEQGDTDG